MLDQNLIKKLGILGISFGLVASPFVVADGYEEPADQTTQNSSSTEPGGSTAAGTDPGASGSDAGMSGTAQQEDPYATGNDSAGAGNGNGAATNGQYEHEGEAAGDTWEEEGQGETEESGGW